MFKKIVFFTFFIFIVFVKPTMAFDKPFFVTVSNNVVGEEGWNLSGQDLLAVPNLIYQESTKAAVPVTWLLRYDAVNNATVSGYFKNLVSNDPSQTIAGYLGLTDKLLSALNIKLDSQNSRETLSWFSPDIRKKIIDLYMNNFLKVFGYYPQIVSNCYLDSFSLNYLNTKYSVIGNIACDEKKDKVGDRISGGYSGASFIPSKNNALRPSQSSSDRLGIVTIKQFPYSLFKKTNPLPTEDLFNFFIDNDINEFSNLNFSWGNELEISKYREEITNTFYLINRFSTIQKMKITKAYFLSEWILNRYPEASPFYIYKFTQKNELAYLYQNPFYKIQIESNNGKTQIVDLRIYNKYISESDYLTPSVSGFNYSEIPNEIQNTNVFLDFDLKSSQIKNTNWNIEVISSNKSFVFQPRSISFTGFSSQLISSQIKEKKDKNQTIWSITPKIPFTFASSYQYFHFACLLLILMVLISKNYVLGVGLLLAYISILTVVRSGYLYSFGLGIWGPNGHDAIFHISLANKFMIDPLNFSHPQISGEKLSNYHLMFDYFLGIISRFTSINPNIIYFQIYPIILGSILTILVYKILKKWQFNNRSIIFSYIFIFLGGSLGFIPAIINRSNPLLSESQFWANQGASIFLNPPFVLSLCFILLFLYVYDSKSDKKISSLLLLALIGGILSQTKIYAFILLVFATFLTKKYKLTFYIIFIGSLITLPFLKLGGSSPFIIQPLWFIKSLFASYDRFWWPKLSQAWQTYELSGAFIKLIIVNLFAIFVFLIGNLGTRIISFLYLDTNTLTKKIALYISIVGIILPLVIVQNLNPWNTIQFMYYSLFFLGVFSGQALDAILSRKNSLIRYLIVITFIFITVFTSLGTITSYLTFYSASRISNIELYALKELANQPKGTVLSPLFDPKKASKIDAPKPLYAYISTAYVSAFSGQTEYLSDTINLDITGYNYTSRSRQIQRFYQTDNKDWAIRFLQSEQISYVYETPLSRLRLNYEDICLNKIFDSGEINIYKFNCHVQK